MIDPNLDPVLQETAKELAVTAVKAVARKLGRGVLGTPLERAMLGVYSRAIGGTLVEVERAAIGERANREGLREELHVAETVLDGLLSDDVAAGLLMDSALRPRFVPVEDLRERALELGYEPGTLPFDFEAAIGVLLEKIFEEFISEAGKENSPVQPLVNEQLLYAIRSQKEEQYLRSLEAEPEPPSTEPPPAPLVFEGRDSDLSELKRRLFGDGEVGGFVGARTVVLTGIPGVGKTALAAVAANDHDIRERFPDGTLWVSLGPCPDVVEELGGLARRLGAGSDVQPASLAEAQHLVASLLSKKRVLLVVDDVYGATDAAAFRLAAPDGAMLLTTRDREVAQQLAPDRPGPVVVQELSEDDSLKLLAELAPGVVERHRTEAEALVRELVGLPLAIRVAGGLLAAEERMGWGVEELLGELRGGRRVLEARAPADRLPVPEATSPTVAALLRASLERLSPEIRARFRVLGAFPSKPVSFDVFAAARVWGMRGSDEARGTVRELANRGLLEPAGSGRFYVHPILASYARMLLETEAQSPNLRDARLAYASHYQQELEALGTFYSQGGQSMLRALEIFDQNRVHYEVGQRWAEGQYSEDADAARVCIGYGRAAPLLVLQKLKPSERKRWLESALSAAEEVGDMAAYHRIEELLVTVYLDTGETERAVEILERHLEEARAAGDREAEMVALGNRANAHGDQYELAAAEACYQGVLEIAQEIGDERHEAQALGALGEAHISKGEYPQAIHLLERRLAIARQAEDLRSEAKALRQLGSAVRRLPDPQRAVELLGESVQIFETMGDRHERGEALNSLGGALAELGDTDGAEQRFGEALRLAREEEDPSLEAFALGNLGNIAGELRGNDGRALELYGEQLEIAERVGDKVNQAIASWNIACSHRRSGRMPAAVDSGREALRLYEQAGDARAEEVREYLRRWEGGDPE